MGAALIRRANKKAPAFAEAFCLCAAKLFHRDTGGVNRFFANATFTLYLSRDRGFLRAYRRRVFGH